MEIKGRVYAKPQSDFGVSSRGQWKKAYLVIRYEEGNYPKDILLANLKKPDDFERIPLGATGSFKFDAKTRNASNGKWYCDLECWAWDLDNNSANAGNGPI